MVKLYHYTSKDNLDGIMNVGLVPTSKYEKFSRLRDDVVFCWLSPNDQKIFDENSICLEVSVDERLCTVAEMDYISFAMMYKYGGKKYGGKNIPINLEASKLFIKLYETTANNILQFEKDWYFTPEVLVKGKIEPSKIKLYSNK